MEKKRSAKQPNSIDYITLSKPEKVRDLIEQYGYDPPKQLGSLTLATKQLIKKEGRQVIKDLLALHPDRSAILKTLPNKEDNYCNACSSYSYNGTDNYCGVCGHSAYDGGSERDFIHQLDEMSIPEMERYYDNLVSKSADQPEDKNIAKEVQLVWNQLRQAKQKDKLATLEKKGDAPAIEKKGIHLEVKDAVIISCMLLLAGGLVGSSLKFGSL